MFPDIKMILEMTLVTKCIKSIFYYFYLFSSHRPRYLICHLYLSREKYQPILRWCGGKIFPIWKKWNDPFALLQMILFTFYCLFITQSLR